VLAAFWGLKRGPSVEYLLELLETRPDSWMTDQVPSKKDFNAQNDFVEWLQTGRRLSKSLGGVVF